MNLELAPEALEYGRAAKQAIEAAGGDSLVQQAEVEPARREQLMSPVLAELGAWELAPRANADEAEAAAALCRSAGYWGLAYPVAERLSRPSGLDVDGLVIVNDMGSAAPSAAVAELDLRWAATTIDGRRSTALPRPAAAGPRTGGFVTELELTPADEDGAGEVGLPLVLGCWTLLGMLDRAIQLTREHISVRVQFGQPLEKLQGVQFQLTDAEVERSGLDMLAKHALWSVQTAQPGAVEDALALRLAALEAAEVVFRVSHQLHGATGFCDEEPLSWLSRYSQPLRRLPFGLSATRERLADRLGRRGLAGLYSEPMGA